MGEENSSIGDKLSQYFTEKTPEIPGAEPELRIDVMGGKQQEITRKVAELNLPMVTDEDGNFIRYDGKSFTEEQAKAVEEITRDIDQFILAVQGLMAGLARSISEDAKTNEKVLSN